MSGLISDIVTSVLLLIGAVFCLLASLGILFMTDIYTRMQAASKAVTLGATGIILAVVVRMPELGVAARGLLVCAFLVVTIPAATHLLARAAYRNREPLADETEVDELDEAIQAGADLDCPVDRTVEDASETVGRTVVH